MTENSKQYMVTAQSGRRELRYFRNKLTDASKVAELTRKLASPGVTVKLYRLVKEYK